jgi:hypothetical protein
MDILDRRKPSWSFRKLAHRITSFDFCPESEERILVVEIFNLPRGYGGRGPLEACNTMAGSIPCIIIDGSFLSGRTSKGGSTSEVSERAIMWWLRLRYHLRKSLPELRG